MNGNVDPILDLMVERIVKNHRPDKIILFGSRARGNARPESDYDLLVIADIEGKHRDYRRAIYHSLYELRLGVGKDIVVATPEEIKRFAGLIGTILTPATQEGRVVYDRAA